MSGVLFPESHRLERLTKAHSRRSFSSGQVEVDAWLKSNALQHQEKHLSATKVLIDDADKIAGYYTLATGQIDFGDLPEEIARKLPRRILPVAILAWLGVSVDSQRHGLGSLLVAQALRDCYDASRTFAFIAVILDCVDSSSKAFYRQFDFAELPGHPYRLFLPFSLLERMVEES